MASGDASIRRCPSTNGCLNTSANRRVPPPAAVAVQQPAARPHSAGHSTGTERSRSTDSSGCTERAEACGTGHSGDAACSGNSARSDQSASDQAESCRSNDADGGNSGACSGHGGPSRTSQLECTEAGSHTVCSDLSGIGGADLRDGVLLCLQRNNFRDMSAQ